MPSEESSISKYSLLTNLLQFDDMRRGLVVYLVAMALILIGGAYALWRINLLSAYLTANREYVLARDARWEQHIKGQAALTRLILERLPEHK